MKFYMTPAFLFEDAYASIGAVGKLLFTLLYDRKRLSEANGWTDADGTYCYMSREQMAEKTGSSIPTVKKTMKKLAELGLVREVRQGLGKPNKIYVILPEDEENGEKVEEKNKLSEQKKTAESDSNNLTANHNEKAKTNTENNTKSDIDKACCGTETFKNTNAYIASADDWDKIFRFRLDFETWFENDNKDMAEGIIALMADIMVSDSDTCRIAGNDIPVNQVKSRFMRLTSDHIRYVIECLRNCRSKIKNYKNYIQTCLYESFTSIHLWNACRYNNIPEYNYA